MSAEMSAQRPSLKDRFPGVETHRVEDLLHTPAHRQRVELRTFGQTLSWQRSGFMVTQTDRPHSNPLDGLDRDFARLSPQVDKTLVAHLGTQGWTPQEIGAAWEIEIGQIERPDGWPPPGSLEYIDWWNGYDERRKMTQ